MQVLSYYLMIANGGRWVQPKLVKAVLSEDPDSLERGSIRWKLGHRFDTVRTKKIFSPTIAAQLTTMLESVVEEKGTGTQAQLTDWPVAGKTGTAQKVDAATHRYSRTRHIATFAGFAPSKNPKLVALVVLDEPQKHFYAGETAGQKSRRTGRPFRGHRGHGRPAIAQRARADTPARPARANFARSFARGGRSKS
ncbi:MAG: hypothetical protein HY074_11475 [Deltaproteobacteria bacterium]|nr:hypothetical protein [Deltaproteobacteria bacterium]